MPQSRKRQGHPHHSPADVPSSQRITGHLLWALLFAVFGFLMALFAAGGHVVALVLGAAAGAVVGWTLGRKMERESKA